ncbi:MAG: hypothetical protein JHD16_16555 [Solirubrobacteraceae bacterium]|nr:hypothetical protein [Solirubrobacteraceae bacterium]
MSGEIKLNPTEMDDAAKRLRGIERALADIGPRLNDSFCGGSPPAHAKKLASVLRASRHHIDQTGVRAGRQADTLTTRASLARLANGEGTAKDVARLIALTSGKRGIDPLKQPRLTAIINSIASTYRTPAAGAAGVPLQLARWAKYWDRAAPAAGRGRITLPKTKVKAFVLGKTKWRDLARALDAAAKAARALKLGPDRQPNTQPKTPSPTATAPPVLEEPPVDEFPPEEPPVEEPPLDEFPPEEPAQEAPGESDTTYPAEPTDPTAEPALPAAD